MDKIAFLTREGVEVVAKIRENNPNDHVVLICSEFNNKLITWQASSVDCDVVPESSMGSAVVEEYDHFVFDLYDQRRLATHVHYVRTIGKKFTLLRSVLGSILPKNDPAWTVKCPEGTVEVYQVALFNRTARRTEVLGNYVDRELARTRQINETLELRRKDRGDHVHLYNKAALVVNGKYYLVSKIATKIIGALPA
jgi:hypothetical protein